MDRIYKLRLDTEDPDIDFEREREFEANKPTSLFVERNKQEGRKLWIEKNEDVSDFYDDNDRFTVTNKERNNYKKYIAGLEPWERKALERAIEEDKNYYILKFSNLGGLVMPILLELTYTDDSQENILLPAEIWRRSPKEVHKLLVLDKDIKQVIVDPKMGNGGYRYRK